MARHHVNYVKNLPVVDRIKEYHTPAGVQQNHGQCLGGTRQEEHIWAADQAHRSRTHRNGEDVYQGKEAADDSKAQTWNIRQYVLVFRDPYVVGHLLQSFLSLSQ